MTRPISVAVPWSLTHYIPLNGFHPLYRALFDDKPDWINLYAWDNVELSERLSADPAFRSEILKEASRSKTWMANAASSEAAQQYYAHYWHANHALTRLIPGDIELHHTAPYPSLSRPFVFHCESFDLFFFPCLNPATIRESIDLRRHYLGILESPLCLGISSHLSSTLNDISNYFQSDKIDRKLFESGMGIDAGKIPDPVVTAKGPVDEPVMLFLNSANQNPQNFFRRGGHLALRCWQALMQDSHTGRLIMRCAKPSDDALRDHGVDVAWLHRHLQSNILWIENFVSSDEIASLMQLAHFMLLPSIALHSVSIMQSMHHGAIPVVSDTVGTERYIVDGQTGIMLGGLRNSLPREDIATNVQAVLNTDALEYGPVLLDQMIDRLRQLISSPDRYATLQGSMLKYARNELDGPGFSQKFWSKVREAYRAFPETPATSGHALKHSLKIPAECFIQEAQWSRLFSSSPQPVPRLHAGRGRVTELGGCFIASPGAQAIGVHEWSPLAEFSLENAPHLYVGRTIKGIGGRYLGLRLVDSELSAKRRVVRWISDRLMPYPALFSLASRSLKASRRALGIIPKTGQSVMATDWGDQFPEYDIELISQLDNGLNVIRCGYLYYAIAQTDGEFSKARADAGKFSVCLTGMSLKEILFKVEEWQHAVSRESSIELMEEGVAGYNLIRYNDRIYAIRQEDGAFSPDRVFNNSYINMHSAMSIEAAKAAVLGSRQ